MFDNKHYVSIALGEREIYNDTPYYGVNIDIKFSTRSIPVKLVINKETKFVNLSRVFGDLQKGANAKYKAFMDYKHLKSVLLFADTYSLIKYGHVHFTYEKRNIYNLPDDKLLTSDPINVVINPDLTNKGKIIKYNLLCEVSNEVYGEKNNTKYNDCKGQYGEYIMISKMLTYISPIYEVIVNEVMDFIRKIIETDSSELDTIQEQKMLIQEKISTQKEILNQKEEIPIQEENIPIQEGQESFMDDDLRTILDKTCFSKGNDAEDWVLKIFNKYIPDMKNCSYTPKSCDLYSPSLKIRVEVKCHPRSEKPLINEEKFHRDCHACIEDTNVFVYLNLNPTSTMVSRIEVDPLRIYLGIKDFNENIVKLIIETSKNYNAKRIVSAVGKLTGNIVIQDIRTILQDTLANEFTDTIINCFNDTIDMVRKEYEETPKGERIKGRNRRINEHKEDILRFFEENKSLFEEGYPKTKTYEKYLDWCNINTIQQIRNEEFCSVFVEFCKDSRKRNPDGTSTRIWKIPKN